MTLNSTVFTPSHRHFKPGALYRSEIRLVQGAWDDYDVDLFYGEAGTYLLCLKWQVFAETDRQLMAHVTFLSLSTLTEMGLMVTENSPAVYIYEVSRCEP